MNSEQSPFWRGSGFDHTWQQVQTFRDDIATNISSAASHMLPPVWIHSLSSSDPM